MTEHNSHLNDMKKYIDLFNTGQADTLVESIQVAPERASPILEHTTVLTNFLLDSGVERLAILFEDRSHAEVILENCDLYQNKLAEENEETCNVIAEAMGTIFTDLSRDQFELAGFTGEDISFMQNNVNMLTESFMPIIAERKEIDNLRGIVANVKKLIERWEMQQIEDEDDILAEGIELGYNKAADELNTILADLEQKTKKCL